MEFAVDHAYNSIQKAIKPLQSLLTPLNPTKSFKMQFTTSIITAALALTASAAPANQKRGASGGTNGSIFRFGDATECHHILRDAGACGISTYFQGVNQEASFVAVPAEIFDQFGAAQNNALCGKTITLTHNGVTQTGVVADRNLSNDHSVDMCLDLWTGFGGVDGDGTVIHDISYSIDN